MLNPNDLLRFRTDFLEFEVNLREGILYMNYTGAKSQFLEFKLIMDFLLFIVLESKIRNILVDYTYARLYDEEEATFLFQLFLHPVAQETKIAVVESLDSLNRFQLDQIKDQLTPLGTTIQHFVRYEDAHKWLSGVK